MSQKPTRSAPAKNENEYATFETALKKVLSVPHSALKAATRPREASAETAEETGFRPRFPRKGLERRFAHLASHLRKGQPLPRDLR